MKIIQIKLKIINAKDSEITRQLEKEVDKINVLLLQKSNLEDEIRDSRKHIGNLLKDITDMSKDLESEAA